MSEPPKLYSVKMRNTWVLELRDIIDLVVDKKPQIPRLIVVRELLYALESPWLHVVAD